MAFLFHLKAEKSYINFPPRPTNVQQVTVQDTGQELPCSVLCSALCSALCCAALGQSRRDASAAPLDIWRQPLPSQTAKNTSGMKEREEIALTRRLPTSQEGAPGQDEASQSTNPVLFLAKGSQAWFFLMLNGPKNYLGRVRHKVQCAWDEWLHALPLLSQQRCVTFQKTPWNALSPSRSDESLSSRTITQQTRFIYQSSARLGPTQLLSSTTLTC